MTVSNIGSPARGSTAKAALPSDAEHDRALVQLMGQLEQILVRLDSLSSARRLPGSIEIAKEMLIELIEFTEQRFDHSAAKPLIDRVCDLHETTKRFERVLGGQSWNGFAALIGIKMSYPDEAKAMFQKFGIEVIDLVEAFFELLESRFDSKDRASEWKTSTQVFLDDLVKRWNFNGTI